MAVDNKTVLGLVGLTVRDLALMVDFYQRNIGLKLLPSAANTAVLAVGDRPLLILKENPQAKPPGRTTGLYHFAILLPSRAALAMHLRHLIQNGVSLQGAADHLVSEALYLADPEGNGIEIYRDRPEHQWPRANGQLSMASNPLDFTGLLAELGPHEAITPELPAGTILGHVHLRVSDLAAAEIFYRDILAMDLQLRFGHSAAFLSYHGYHHHIGINTWESLGRPPAPSGAQGLSQVAITVPDKQLWNRIEAAVKRENIPMVRTDSTLILRDPSGNALVLTSP